MHCDVAAAISIGGAAASEVLCPAMPQALCQSELLVCSKAHTLQVLLSAAISLPARLQAAALLFSLARLPQTLNTLPEFLRTLRT